ncbi:Gfo/Idh/MocA family oxidoreductase [Gramella sp. AN32]|uniref:Gfo/Idh/MocA family protein n=1 Tax=Christiangramia antarctica TaxID=2058158 RepID=A0ABW5X237_9FLAO|nr:Gfo/Idh/MocA family oxidoreductase [Gramella sp. AN32]MCM4157025.1 acetylgalactosaminidase [Gramella sp. AN32]
MSSDRRSFLRNMALGSGAIAAGSILTSCGSEERLAQIKSAAKRKPTMRFNMSGYAAPPLDIVRIGIVGIGDRGSGAVERMTYIEGVEITALCDTRQAAVDGAQGILKNAGLPKAAEFVNGDTGYKEMCQSDLVDLVYVVTSWEWHIPIALEAMENDKHTAVEVSTARTLDECWQIVETSERTRKHCVILENCCYDFFELLTLNMVRQGVFGDLIHGEGAYIHNLDYWMFNIPEDDKMVDGAYTDFWRMKENRRHANVYPTHGLGPICQAMNINRGDKMDYLTAMMSDDFNFAKNIKKHAAENPIFEQFVGWDMRGNMDIQLIKTNKGRTIMIQHDVTSPRPYSRIHMLSGTECFAQKWPLTHIAFGHEVADAAKMKELEEKYTPEIVRRVGEMAKKVGGHGGMDFIMDWRLIDCLRNGLPMDMDVYDAASWSSITSLSEWSIANKSNSIEVPDFTRGAWKMNKPVNLSLDGGGTTGVRNLENAGAKQLSVE